MNKKDKLSLIDTHAHLTFPDYDSDRDDVLKRSWDAGLDAIVVIGSGGGLQGNRDAVEFASRHPNVYVTVGIHPHDAANVDIDQVVGELRKLASDKKVVAIGEIGLDYHREQNSAPAQRKCFQRLIELADELRLPISIHDRDAHKDTLYNLREQQNELSGGIFHCFSGDLEMAREVVQMGFYIAIPGIITFKKADQLKEIVREIPLEYLVLETDCPFLAPEPYRGKRNEPAYLVHVAEAIAEITKLTVADVGRITTINARRAFNLPGLIPEGKIAYSIRKSLYLNLTNRCTLACDFCPKQSSSFEVKGHNLKLPKEPDVEDVFRAVGEIDRYEEIVFCGFGEPTLRLELLKEIARRIKEKGMRIRLDTDGLANLVHRRNVLPELDGLIDAVSVSMNAPDSKTYQNLCPSKYGEKAYEAMLTFLKEAKNHIPEVTATIVSVSGIDIETCRRIAKDIGVEFRVRKHQNLG